jgi:hypothetical protein
MSWSTLLKGRELGHVNCMVTPKNCKASKKDIKNMKPIIFQSF